MESWRKFLNERMEFGENFERWLHGEPTEDDLESDVDDQWFGRAPFCKAQSIDPDCLKKYGFRKIENFDVPTSST